ncbi:OmpA family protein [Reyranella soli]|uniref:Membrane protein n=1 Tax=Reyranella soli TaxID=1230389 RepID=A0A512NK12_9HYPH|nr:OmpA family protein [Reyranella soli]GEP59291.1 membrane protein [Reyranella soli]
MKKVLIAVAAIAALPATAQAQDVQMPGVYFGVQGGLNWLFNTTILGQNVSPQTGWALGGKFGYDFIGPRVEVEGLYRQNNNGNFFGGRAITGQISQVTTMANFLYDFNATGTFVPYIGAGAGVGFIDSDYNLGSTTFAYQGILGVGYNATPNLRFNLEGRYIGTTNPQVAGTSWTNNNIALLAAVQVKFGGAAPPPPPPPPPVAPPSFMVFFDWDRSNLSQQALATIKQAADAFKQKGNARITATGHTDTSGPEAYNMALSLRRANAVKDALVREGVPAQAITVIGRGEQGLLVQTGDGVREPQNRRVEIVIQ